MRSACQSPRISSSLWSLFSVENRPLCLQELKGNNGRKGGARWDLIEAARLATGVDGDELDRMTRELAELPFINQAFWSPSTTGQCPSLPGMIKLRLIIRTLYQKASR